MSTSTHDPSVRRSLITCAYCGLPVRHGQISPPEGRAYCCLGCEMVDRLTSNRSGSAGAAPHTSWWMLLLLLAFLFFNQAFFLLLELAVSLDPDSSLAALSLWAGFSLLCGFAFQGVLVWGNRSYMTVKKGLVLLLAPGLLAVLGLLFWGRSDLAGAVSLALSALLAWIMARGLRQLTKKPPGPSPNEP